MKISLRSIRAGALALGLLSVGTAVEAATTVVSITFGGGMANQMPTLPLLAQHGFKGTYYLITGAIGQPGGYMTAAQVNAVAAAGHEIGSVGVNHLDLTTVSYSTMVYEACASRQALLDMGISPVVSFDYPYGHSDGTVESVVQSCGYSSGRRSYGLGCPYSSCLVAENIPPANPYFIRTVPVIQSTTTLSEIQQYIVNAENSGGGWVPLAFINVCDSCAQYSITQADFASLLSWLADRSSRGTVVRSVAQVMSGDLSLPPPPTDSNVGLAADLTGAKVFPNPWRVDRHSGSGVTIDGLPPRSEIRFFTLSGRWVKTVDASAGGQGTWGLTDDSGAGVASGIYRYLITAPGVERKRGSLTIVR